MEVNFICLNKSHRATTSQRQSRYGEGERLGRHRNLPDQAKVRFAPDTPKASVVCSISQTNQKPVRFGILAVGVVNSTGLARELALVGSG